MVHFVNSPDGRTISPTGGTCCAIEALERRRLLAVTLVRDINPTADLAPHSAPIQIGGAAYFPRVDDDDRPALWKSDGTEAGTVKLGNFDITGRPSGLTELSGRLYFFASRGLTPGLWTSDGTVEGTVPVTTVAYQKVGASASAAATADGWIYFSAAQGAGGYELWRTDGTAANTAMVADINTTAADASSSPAGLTALGGAVYFAATDGRSGTELWRSDGTAAGTVRLADLNPGPGSSDPAALHAMGGRLFFTADDGATGVELYSTDGTAAAAAGRTGRVMDIQPGPVGSDPASLTASGGLLYFSANNGTKGTELWATDGTEAGTRMVKDINTNNRDSSSPRWITPFSGGVAFQAGAHNAAGELWRSDGTADGTVLVKDINPVARSNPTGLTVHRGVLYFAADDGAAGIEVWRSDGTADGTTLLKDIAPGRPFGRPSAFAPFGDSLLFLARNAADLYKTDGTPAGTALVKPLGGRGWDAEIGDLGVLGDAVFFTATDGTRRGLWKSDGTHDGTVLVTEDVPRDLINPTRSGDLLYFSGIGGLYRTDGTRAGTMLLKQFTGPGNVLYPNPYALTDVNGTLFFAADDGTHGIELWKSDGTPQGTVLVKDAVPGSIGSGPENLAAVGDTLFFSADLEPYSRELWKSDGTAGGTVMVKDINPGPFAPVDRSIPAYLTDLNGTLLFAANDGERGYELWRSDGTEAGTVIVKDIAAGAGSGVALTTPGIPFATVNGAVYFAAADSQPTGDGYSLWTSDGTADGTRLVKHLPHDADPRTVRDLTDAGGTLYFTGYQGPRPVHIPTYNQFYTSDGTAGGTTLLAEYASVDGHGYWRPEFTAAHGRVYFGADAPGVGPELWQTDGTAAGTSLAGDTYPGARGSDPTDLVSVNGMLLFTAETLNHGRELWAVPPPTPRPPARPMPLSARAVSPTQIMVEWADNSGDENGFRVERSTTADFASVDATFTVAADQTSYTDGGPAPLRTYYYRARAYNAAGESAHSPVGAAAIPTPPIEPAGLTAAGLDATSINLTWSDRATNEDGYRLERSRQADFATVERSVTVGRDLTTFNDTGLVRGTTYHYRLVAFNAAGDSAAVTTSARAGSRVIGRHVFYNHSFWDNPANGTGFGDDASIATDKSPLLPGQTALPASYTSFSKGINGVMVDVTALPAGVSLLRTDLQFRVGNSAAAPATWAAAPTPASLSVRRGAGVDGSDRIVLTWADGAIRNTWLQVTVPAGTKTGLAAADVFYFGNAVGDTMNSTTSFRVDSQDVTRTRNAQQSKPTTIQGLYDHNRDGRVNTQDQVLARGGQGTTLAKITAPVVAGVAAAAALGRPGSVTKTASWIAAVVPTSAALSGPPPSRSRATNLLSTDDEPAV